MFVAVVVLFEGFVTAVVAAVVESILVVELALLTGQLVTGSFVRIEFVDSAVVRLDLAPLLLLLEDHPLLAGFVAVGSLVQLPFVLY